MEGKGNERERKRGIRLCCLFTKEEEGKEIKFHFPSISFLLWRDFDLNKIKRLSPSKPLPLPFCYPNKGIFILSNPSPSFPSISFNPNKALSSGLFGCGQNDICYAALIGGICLTDNVVHPDSFFRFRKYLIGLDIFYIGILHLLSLVSVFLNQPLLDPCVDGLVFSGEYRTW